VISPSPWPLPAQHTQETNIEDFSGIQTHDPSNQEVPNLRLTATGPSFLSLLRHSVVFTQAQYTNGFLGGVFRLTISHTLSLFCRDILYLKFVVSHFLTARLTCRTLKYNEQRVGEVRHTSASQRKTFTIISLKTVITNLLAHINCNTSNRNKRTLKSGPSRRVGLLRFCLLSRTAE
jgi:hypothetical protein